MHRCTERSKHRSGRDVYRVELIIGPRSESNAHSPIAAFDHEYVAFQPEPVGQTGEQWRDRREDPASRQVRASVADERASVDQHGYRWSRWE